MVKEFWEMEWINIVDNFNLYIIKTMDWTFASQSTIIAVHKDTSLAIPFFMLISLLRARGVEYL